MHTDNTPATTPPPLLRARAVMEAYGTSRTALYVLMRDGLFPRPIKLGDRLVAWPEDECHAVINARIAGWTEEEIRQLVSDLTDARKTRVTGVSA